MPTRTATPIDNYARTAPARAAHQRNAAIRALDDPRQLGRAARIVRAALERRMLTLDELVQIGGGADV